MKKFLKSLLGSKKFWATVTTILVWTVGKIGFDVGFDELWPVMAALQGFVIGQGIADVGKEKAKVEAEGAVAAMAKKKKKAA